MPIYLVAFKHILKVYIYIYILYNLTKKLTNWFRWIQLFPVSVRSTIRKSDISSSDFCIFPNGNFINSRIYVIHVKWTKNSALKQCLNWKHKLYENKMSATCRHVTHFSNTISSRCIKYREKSIIIILFVKFLHLVPHNSAKHVCRLYFVAIIVFMLLSVQFSWKFHSQ